MIFFNLPSESCQPQLPGAFIANDHPTGLFETFFPIKHKFGKLAPKNVNLNANTFDKNVNFQDGQYSLTGGKFFSIEVTFF